MLFLATESRNPVSHPILLVQKGPSRPSEKRSVPLSTNVHYKPLPLLTAYKELGFDIADYPNAYNLFLNEISLPLYSTLSDEAVDYIIDSLLEVVKDYF